MVTFAACRGLLNAICFTKGSRDAVVDLAEYFVLDFATFVEQTSQSLVKKLNAGNYYQVWFKEFDDYVEWRLDAYGVKLFRGNDKAPYFSYFYKHERCAPRYNCIMDATGTSVLVEAIIDHAVGRARIDRKLSAVK